MAIRSSILVITLTLICLHIADLGIFLSYADEKSKKEEVRLESILTEPYIPSLTPTNDNLEVGFHIMFCCICGKKIVQIMTMLCFRFPLLVNCLSLQPYLVIIPTRNSGEMLLLYVLLQIHQHPHSSGRGYVEIIGFSTTISKQRNNFRCLYFSFAICAIVINIFSATSL